MPARCLHGRPDRRPPPPRPTRRARPTTASRSSDASAASERRRGRAGEPWVPPRRLEEYAERRHRGAAALEERDGEVEIDVGAARELGRIVRRRSRRAPIPPRASARCARSRSQRGGPVLPQTSSSLSSPLYIGCSATRANRISPFGGIPGSLARPRFGEKRPRPRPGRNVRPGQGGNSRPVLWRRRPAQC